jgi:hypothetical protein
MNTERLLDSFNIVMSSYGFIINLLPIYYNLKPELRTSNNGLKISATALTLTACIYLAFAYMCICSFGISNISQNVFNNLQDSGFLTKFIKVLFLVIFVSAIPYTIYPVKECALNMVSNKAPVSDQKHTMVALCLLFAISLTSVFVNDLTVVFGIIAAFLEATTHFILPGLFLIITEA